MNANYTTKINCAEEGMRCAVERHWEQGGANEDDVKRSAGGESG